MRYIIAIIFVIFNAVLGLMDSQGFENKENMIIHVLTQAVLAPAIFSLLFCIPKSNRSNKKFFKAFNVISLIIFLTFLPKVIKKFGSPPKTIQGKFGIMEITVPNPWREGYYLENASISLLDNLGVTSLLIGVEEIEDGLDIEQQAQRILNHMNKDDNFISSTIIMPCKTQKFECVYQEVKMSYGEKGTISYVATLKSTNYFYNYMATTSTPLYEGAKIEFIKMLQSINET